MYGQHYVLLVWFIYIIIMDWSSTTVYSLCLIIQSIVCSLSVTVSCCHCSVNGCNGFQCKERLQEKCVAISNCHCLEYTYLLEDLICSEAKFSTLVK